MKATQRHPYLGVWFGLVGLFLLSLAISAFSPPLLATVAVFAIAFAKAALVAAFFMHLIDGPTYFRYLLLGAGLCVLLLFAGLVPDIVLAFRPPSGY